MKKLLFFIFFPFLVTFVSAQNDRNAQINKTLDAWHKAAAEANYKNYFDTMTDDAILLELMQQRTGVNLLFRRMPNLILIKEKHGVLRL